MINLSPGLMSAMRSRQGRPCVRVVVMDRQWRWSTILQTEGSSLQTAAVDTSGGGILRARITATLNVEVQTVEQPWVATSWQSSWREVTGDAMQGSDVALVRRPGADDLRMFYTKLSGSTYYLRCVESGDDGATWGTATDVCSSSTEIGSLAASGTVIFYLHNGEVRRRWKPWTSGNWGGEATWTGCGQLAEDHGLAAALHDGVHHVAVAGKWGDDRRLRTGTYSGGTGWSSKAEDVVPPGTPAPDYCPRWPSLAVVDGAMYLGYLDTYEGTPSFSVPVVISTPDWDHWGCACALDLGWQTLKRLNVVYSSPEASLFAAMELDAAGSREYDASDPGRKLVEHDVAFYQIDVGEGYGYMLVDIVNRARRYDDFGQSDKRGEPIKPLSEVVIERGYRTSAGDEYVASSPYYLVKASHRVGVGRPALRLLCVDGWGLMGRWEVDQSYRWSDKSIRWLITELVSRSTGFECQFDDSSEWNTVIAEFALHPRGWAAMKASTASERGTVMPPSSWSGTATQGVNALLKKIGGRARWDQQGRLNCIIPSNQSIADWYSYGENDEIIEGEYGVALVAPNVLRVIGEGTGWQTMHLSQGQTVGRRLIGIAVDLHLDEWDECQAMAGGMWDRAAAGEYGGWLEVHLNPGQELWDFVSVTDVRCGYSAAMRRVAGICEVWNSVRRRYSSVLRLEGT